MGKANKEVADEAKIAAQREAERRKAIADFNMQNMGKFWIDPDKVPTDEDINNAKEEFEKRTKALQEKHDYVLADKANALRVAKFIKNFNDTQHWKKDMWKGVCNFSAMMNDFIEAFDENNPVDLVLDYMPMQYIFLVFENYSGEGLKDAQKMFDMWDEFVPIYDKLHELVDWYNNEVKACEELREKWAMLEQGYYLQILDPSGEEQTQQEDNGTIVPGDLTAEKEEEA